MDSIALGNICGAQRARNLSNLQGLNDQPVENAISEALNTAIGSGLFTTTVDMSTYSAQNIQVWIQILNGLSYTTSYSVSTLTISW